MLHDIMYVRKVLNCSIRPRTERIARTMCYMPSCVFMVVVPPGQVVLAVVSFMGALLVPSVLSVGCCAVVAGLGQSPTGVRSWPRSTFYGTVFKCAVEKKTQIKNVTFNIIRINLIGEYPGEYKAKRISFFFLLPHKNVTLRRVETRDRDGVPARGTITF